MLPSAPRKADPPSQQSKVLGLTLDELEEILARGIRILPQSLSEALDELRGDEVIKSALGVIADDFIEMKTREWETYDQQVTSWEVDEYLTYF